MKYLRRVASYLLYYKPQIALNFLFNLLFVVFSLFSFGMIIPIVNMLFDTNSALPMEVDFSLSKQGIEGWLNWKLSAMKVENGAFHSILLISLIYALCSFFSNLFRYLALYFITPIRNGIVMHLRNEIYERITRLPISFFKKHRKGDLISRFTTDLNEIEWSVAIGLHNFIKEPITIFVYGISLLMISPKLLLLTFLIAPLTLFLVKKIGKSIRKNADRAQNQIGLIYCLLEEALTGIKIIKVFTAEKRVEQDFFDQNSFYTKSQTKVQRRKDIGVPLIETIAILTIVLIITYAGNLVMNGSLAPSSLVFFVLVFSRMIPPFQKIIDSYYNVQKGTAAMRRVFEIIDADELITNHPNAIEIKGFQDKINYKNVCFSYIEEERQEKVLVLDLVNLEIKKGETVALVGPSGSGKTSLVDLLPRFYDFQSGEILIDGIPLKNIDIKALRKLIGIVSQDCVLFNDSIINNIAFGEKEIDKEAVVRAAKIANADEFIKKLPDGYDSLIGDQGQSLSGGQRQRLSIARAILKDPSILILDEATSALDTESEYLVQEALKRLMNGRTSIMIAHRLSTIRHADQILVLEKGRIVERGTHESLLSHEGVYKSLVDFQDIK